MSRKRRQRLPIEPVTVQISGLSHDGRGIAHIEGKATFISGALPDEKVSFLYTNKRGSHDEGKVVEVLEKSPDRIAPACEHADICGGCSLQHLHPEKQVTYKQQGLLDALNHIGKVSPETLFAPLTGERLGYRRKARLGVKYVIKKDKVLVGFRERDARYLADINRCVVLHSSVGEKISALQEMIYSLEARKTIPQIEVAIGDGIEDGDDIIGITSDTELPNTALVFRHLKPLSSSDRDTLLAFAKTHKVQLYLQPKGPDTIHRVWPESATLNYAHPGFSVSVDFSPQDFFQVNRSINLQMVPRAVELLDVNEEDDVLDLFCGLGNFTLPIARKAKSVMGVEGDMAMVKRARETALRNGLHNTQYAVCNLMNESATELTQQTWLKRHYTKILLDPPRSGAKEILPHIAKLDAEKIVYVSCHPASLARDAGLLVNEFGYTLQGAGIMDMFPHTAHVESIAVFNQ